MRIWTGLKWMIRVGVAPASSTVTIPGRAGEERVTDNVCLWIEKKAFHHEEQNTEDYTGTLVLSLSLSTPQRYILRYCKGGRKKYHDFCLDELGIASTLPLSATR